MMRSRHLVAALSALGTAVVMDAQETVPVNNVLQFRLTVTGKGSDPNPSDAVNPPSVPRKATQEWTYSRVIEGWYEVDAVSQRGARDDGTSERVRFKPRPGGRYVITGIRQDRAEQTYLDAFEGSFIVGCASYIAHENWQRTADLGPPDRSLIVELDRKQAVWTTSFLPTTWLGQLELGPEYTGLALYQPPEKAGLGKGWSFFTDKMNERSRGEAFVETRYSPARRGLLPIPMSLANSTCPAEFSEVDEAAAAGHVAKGRYKYRLDKPRDVPGTFNVEGVLEWAVRVEMPEVELDVLIPDYETWRPTTDRAFAGEPLSVIARLRRSDPKKNTPLPKVRKFTWQLVGTSKEPGYAMNMPYAARSPGADLSLDTDAEGAETFDEGQTLIVNNPAIPACRIKVEPWDWGGWGTLRVEALLVDGRVIKGDLAGGPAIIGKQRDIPIPARIPGSKIAMGWLNQNHVNWTDDAEDSDPSPVGKGTGDGLTLYQEYRGFYWGTGQHLSTDPRTKDLFLRIEPAAESYATRAVGMWSGLAVHWTKRAEYLPNAQANQRVININVGNGASGGPQTALYVTAQTSAVRINDLIPPGSRPATVAKIDLPSLDAMRGGDVPLGVSLDGVGADTRIMLLHQLSQAILQACGVERPGPSDRIQRVAFVPGKVTLQPQSGAAQVVPPHFRIGGIDALIYLGATDVAASQAECIARTGIAAEDLFYVIGEKGGAHSGPEDCVMRDFFARIYRTEEVRDGLPIYRFAPDQKPGTRLGTTRAGTGINARNRSGGSVFGDSAVAEPAKMQLVVKDGAK